MMDHRRFWMAAIVLGGVGCSGYGLRAVRETGEFLQRAEKTSARITYLETKLKTPEQKIQSWDYADEHSVESYRTTIFTTRSGRRVVYQRPLSMTIKSEGTFQGERTYVPEDQIADVLYDPQDPYNFRYADRGAPWAIAAGFVVFGIALLSLGTSAAIGLPVGERTVDACQFMSNLFLRRRGPGLG